MGAGATADALREERPASIWDRQVDDSGLTYREQVIERQGPTEVEPVELPLPAPVIAAGLGLGVVLLIRRRFQRG